MKTKSIVLMSLVLAVGATPLHAASPSQPAYKVTASYVKIAEGENGGPGGKTLAVDGTTVYSINQTQGDTTPEGQVSPELRITRSFDGGVTWNSSEVMNTFTGSMDDGYGIRISTDKVYPGQKLIHTIWSQDGLNYRYFSTQTGAWSNKVVISDTIPLSVGFANTFNIDGNGSVHALFNGYTPPGDWSLYYSSATKPDAGFTYPVKIAEGVYTADSTIDKQNNVLVTYTGGADSAYFMKKAAGSSTWSTPVLVSPGNSLGNWYASSITSFDANNIYIAHLTYSKFVFAKSADGGKTWTNKTLATAGASSHFDSFPAIVVNPVNKTLTIAVTVRNDATGNSVNVYRSLDGVNWTAPKTYPGLEHPSLAIDSAGKTYLTMAQERKNPNPSLADSFATDRTVFFTRE